MICGNLALTSTQCPNGTITAEVARRQHDGTWLWVVDLFSKFRIFFVSSKLFLFTLFQNCGGVGAG
jgi:hypothetical protein